MKVHFLDVPEPTLQEGEDLTANCGAVVKGAAFAMKFDFELGDISEWNSLRVCGDCLNLEMDHRFVYGLVSGQETKE